MSKASSNLNTTGSPVKRELLADRNIQFFQLVETKDRTATSIDTTPHLTSIAKKSYGKKRMELENGHMLSATVRSAVSQEFSLDLIRSNDFPLIEHQGNFEEMNLPDGRNLAERTHVKIFENRIVVVAYNHYGPRISQLPRYLEDILKPTKINFHIEPILRTDIADQLKFISSFDSIDVSLHDSTVVTYQQKDKDLFKALHSTIPNEAGVKIGVKVSLNSDAPDGYGAMIKSKVNAVLSTPNFRERYKHLSTKGVSSKTEHVEEINLLKDQFMVSKKILKANAKTRALDVEDVYTSIAESYEELKSELEEAITIQITKPLNAAK